AGFAHVPWRRLFVVQIVFAALVAAAVVWFLDYAWFPTVRNAIRELPAKGEIRSGKMTGLTNSPQLLASGHFLAVVVDLNHSGQVRPPAHVQVEFGERDVRFLSLFGYAAVPYPHGEMILAFNRTELEPWWGAWRPPILGMIFGAVMIWLLFLW